MSLVTTPPPSHRNIAYSFTSYAANDHGKGWGITFNGKTDCPADP